MIAGDALSVRVEDGFPIHQEPVMMMPVIQRDLEEPGAIRLAFHRVCRRVPIIEIAGQKDLLGSRCIAHKIDRLRHLLGGIAVRGEERTNVMHATTNFDSSISDNCRFSKRNREKETDAPVEDKRERGGEWKLAQLAGATAAMRDGVGTARPHIAGAVETMLGTSRPHPFDGTDKMR